MTRFTITVHKRLNISQKRLSPSQKRLSPSQKRLIPSPKRLIPSQKRLRPSLKRLSPSQKRRSPSQKRLSPSQKRLIPSHKDADSKSNTVKKSLRTQSKRDLGVSGARLLGLACDAKRYASVLQCVAVCCSVLQCVAVCCSVCTYSLAPCDAKRYASVLLPYTRDLFLRKRELNTLRKNRKETYASGACLLARCMPSHATR